MSILDIKFVTAPSKRLKKALSSSSDRIVLNNIRNWENESGEAIDLIPDNFGETHYIVLRDKNNTRLEIIEIDPSTIADSEITIRRRGLKFDGIVAEDATLKQSWEVSGTIVELGTHTPQALESLLRLTKQNDFTIIPRTFEIDGTTPATATEDAQVINKKQLDDTETSIRDDIDDLLDDKVGRSGDEDIDGVKTFNDSPIIPDAVDDQQPVTLAQLQAVILTGALPATDTQLGLVSFANDTEFNSGTDTDVDGKPLVAKPSQVQASGINWNPAKPYSKTNLANYLGKLFKSIGDSNLNNIPTEYKAYKDLDKYSSNGIVINSTNGGGSIYNMRFSNDGMYAFTITNGEVLRRFPLTEAYKPDATIVHDQTVTLTSDDSTMFGFDFNSDGTKLYVIGAQNDKVYQYNLAGAFDLTGVTTYDEEYQPNIQLSAPYDIYVKPDDSSLFICDYSTDEINEFVFGTPGDVTTLSYGGERFYTALIEATEYGIFISPDGTKLFMGGANFDNVYSFTLSTPFDITTMSYDNIAFDISAQSSNIYGLYFSTDGTKMYTVDSTDNVRQYNLGTAWDLTTASYGSIAFATTSQENNPRDICFSNDGTKMWVVGTTTDTIFEYDLATAWALNTASYSGNSLLISAQEANPYAIEVAEDGSAIFIIGNTKTLYRYEMGTANDITTASFSDSYLFTGDEATGTIVGIAIKNSGDTGYILDQSLNYIRQINFGTSYDPTTITTNWGGLDLISNPETIQFSPDGYQVYLSNNSQCYKYELMTPWDLSTIIDKYYTRPTTGDAWTETTSTPSLSYNSNSNELGYKFNSMYPNATVKGFKFSALRGSGSSGGTNYGNITGRLYTVDGSGSPLSSAEESGAQSFNTWNTNPTEEFEVIFSAPVSLASIQDFVLSIQYDTTDGDTMTFSKIAPILVTETGIEYEPEQLVSNASLGNYNIVEMSPNQEFIYASNLTHIYEFETSKLFKSIWWEKYPGFGNAVVAPNIITEPGFIFGNASSGSTPTGTVDITFADGTEVSVGHVYRDGSSSSNNPDNSFCVPVGPGDSWTTSGSISVTVYFRPLN